MTDHPQPTPSRRSVAAKASYLKSHRRFLLRAGILGGLGGLAVLATHHPPTLHFLHGLPGRIAEKGRLHLGAEGFHLAKAGAYGLAAQGLTNRLISHMPLSARHKRWGHAATALIPALALAPQASGLRGEMRRSVELINADPFLKPHRGNLMRAMYTKRVAKYLPWLGGGAALSTFSAYRAKDGR